MRLCSLQRNAEAKEDNCRRREKAHSMRFCSREVYSVECLANPQTLRSMACHGWAWTHPPLEHKFRYRKPPGKGAKIKIGKKGMEGMERSWKCEGDVEERGAGKRGETEGVSEPTVGRMIIAVACY